MPRPHFVRCVFDAECPTIDTTTGLVVEGAIGAVLIDAYALDVRAALGVDGASYMERALACARLGRSALAVLFPRLDSERQCGACTIAGQAINLAAWGKGIDPEVAIELAASRASARAVEAAGARCYRGRPELQRKAARAAMAGARRRSSSGAV